MESVGGKLNRLVSTKVGPVVNIPRDQSAQPERFVQRETPTGMKVTFNVGCSNCKEEL